MKRSSRRTASPRSSIRKISRAYFLQLEVRIARRADQLAAMFGPQRAIEFWMEAERKLLLRELAGMAEFRGMA